MTKPNKICSSESNLQSSKCQIYHMDAINILRNRREENNDSIATRDKKDNLFGDRALSMQTDDIQCKSNSSNAANHHLKYSTGQNASTIEFENVRFAYPTRKDVEV